MRVILLSLMMVCLFGYRAKGCANCGDPVTRRCEGFAEIRSEFNGTETVHGKMIKEEGEDVPKKASKLRYRVPGGRRANITIEVLGNCCWKFYQRKYYRGTLESVRGNGTVTPVFAPRSLKVVEC